MHPNIELYGRPADEACLALKDALPETIDGGAFVEDIRTIINKNLDQATGGMGGYSTEMKIKLKKSSTRTMMMRPYDMLKKKESLTPKS